MQINLSKNFTILDDETNIYEYENAIMVVDSNTNNDNNSSTSRTPTQTKSTQPQPTSSLECIPLLDYITNIMKIVEAILSNNSTDDHCKEFVKQKLGSSILGCFRKSDNFVSIKEYRNWIKKKSR